MRKKIIGQRTPIEYKATLESVIASLAGNERKYGDDYTNEKQCLRDILVDYGYALNLASAGNPTIELFWDLQKEKKELEKEVERLREIYQEWLTMWDTLEELNLVADVRKNMREHGFTFETDDEVIE